MGHARDILCIICGSAPYFVQKIMGLDEELLDFYIGVANQFAPCETTFVDEDELVWKDLPEEQLREVYFHADNRGKAALLTCDLIQTTRIRCQTITMTLWEFFFAAFCDRKLPFDMVQLGAPTLGEDFPRPLWHICDAMASCFLEKFNHILWEKIHLDFLLNQLMAFFVARLPGNETLNFAGIFTAYSMDQLNDERLVAQCRKIPSKRNSSTCTE